MPIDYLARLDANRSEGPEFAATARPRKRKALTRKGSRASLGGSTISHRGKEASKLQGKPPMAKKRKGRRKARSAAQKRATAKMIRAAKAKRRGHVKSPRKRARRSRRRAAVSTPVRRKRRKARKSAPKPPKRRRKARRRAAEFSHHDDQSSRQQTSILQIGQQCR